MNEYAHGLSSTTAAMWVPDGKSFSKFLVLECNEKDSFCDLILFPKYLRNAMTSSNYKI